MANAADVVNEMMRAISEALRYPVIIILLILVAMSIFMIGSVIVEALTERRKLKVSLPRLVDQLKEQSEPTETCIRKSGLLKRQKKMLIELTQHPNLSPDMRSSMADSLIAGESDYFARRVTITDMMAKLGPMFGLMGTLIPLGPGIIALGQRNTYVLSQSLLTAFDTTILGLVSAAAAIIISSIRKRWYRNDLSVLETLTDCVLEIEEQKEE